MLAVVHDEQQRPSAEIPDHGLLDRQARTLLDAQRGGDGVVDRAPVGEAAELAEPHPVGEPHPVPGCHLHREPRLPRTADAGQGHQRPRPERSTDTLDLLTAADETARPPRQVALRGCRRQRRIVDEDPPVQRLRLVGGLDAQLVVEPGAQVVVGGQRVGLPAHCVQRAHERDRGSFPGRVASHQCLEPGQRLGGPTQLQQRQRTVFERAGAELGQPRDRGDRELVVGELGEGLAPPQCECRVEVGQRTDVVPRCGGGPCGADELLELGRRPAWPRPGSGSTPADGAAARHAGARTPRSRET